MCDSEASSSTYSGRERRKKSLSLKAKEYYEAKPYLNYLGLEDDSGSDPFAGKLYCK